MASKSRSGIAPPDPPELAEHFTAIGRHAVAWAHLEAGLETALHAMFYGLSIKVDADEFPISLKKRADAFKRAIKFIGLDEPRHTEWLSIARSIKHEAQFRQWVIHGWACAHYIEERAILFAKYDLKFPQADPHTKKIALDEIDARTTRVRQMASPMVELAKQAQRLALERNARYLAPAPPESGHQSRRTTHSERER